MDQTIETLTHDAVEDVALVKRLLAAYKTGGRAALLAELPAISGVAAKQFADAKAALPAIKAGYKTTEFWLIAALLTVNGIHPLPIDVNAAGASLIGIYTIVRGLVKKSPAVTISTSTTQ